jgi:DNA-binding phage protein
MPITRSFRETVIERAKEDKEFRQLMLVRGFLYLMLGKNEEDVVVGRSGIRDYINATLGFQKLAEKTGVHPKSLMQMFGGKGNPSQHNLNLVFRVLFRQEKLDPEDFMRGALLVDA